MKPWILLNILLPAVLAGLMIAAARFGDDLLLPVVAAAACFCSLGILNLFAPLTLWRKYGRRSLLVPLSFALSALVPIAANVVGEEAILSKSPLRPDSFLRDATRTELETIARQLIERGSGELYTGRLAEIRGQVGQEHFDDGLPHSVFEKLQARGFDRTTVDGLHRVVTFGHYRWRKWSEYIIATDSLSPPHSWSPKLTEGDIMNWGMVTRISKHLDPKIHEVPAPSRYEPAVAVPVLREALGDSFLVHLRMTAGEKALILKALNAQCVVTSRLVERAEVTYEGEPPTLKVGTTNFENRSRESAEVASLLRQGVLRRGPDGRQLKLGSGLSPTDERRVEWLQLAIMNVAFGNLIATSEHPFDRPLRDRWWYRRS
jgi:hypothetical protein